MALRKRPILFGSAAVLVAVLLGFLVFQSRNDDDETATAESSPPPEAVASEAPNGLPAIIYAANIGGEFRLFAIDPAGGQSTEILDESATDPVWSPAGDEILFVGETEGASQKRLGLHRIGADGKVSLVKKGPQIPSQISFRPGTDEVAVQSTFQSVGETAGIKYYSSIDLVNTRTGGQKTVFDEGGSAYSPAFSPSGDELLVVAAQVGCRAERGICPQRIDVLAPDGTFRRTLIGSGAAGSPAFSPDGKKVAFTWNRGQGPGVWIVDADGADPKQVTDGKPPVSDPDFSPDGKKVVFSRGCELYVQPIEGGRAVNITRTPEICEITPDWRSQTG